MTSVEPAPFGIEETHGILKLPGKRVQASSDGRHWTSLYASVQRELPFEGKFGPNSNYLLVLHRNGPVRLDSFFGRQGSTATVHAGSINLVPPGVEFGICLDGQLDSVHVYIRRSVLESIALEMIDGDPTKLDLASGIVSSDPVLQSLMETIAFALEGDRIDTPVLADRMAQAMSAHLIRAYGKVPVRCSQNRGQRPVVSITVQKATDYIIARLDRSISVDEIAYASNVSASRLIRSFRNELGIPPHRYLINLRLEKARLLLEKTSFPIAQIASDCGFCHQEHLTHWFRRSFDTTPAAFRRSTRKTPNSLQPPPRKR